MKKGWLVGCGIAGILGIGLCAGVGFFFFRGVIALTQPVVDASEQFLALLGQGKTEEAYASTADGFRAQLDAASFNRAVEQLGLAEYASASWHNRQFKNQDGTAEGTVTTKGGGTKPVSIQLVYEVGKWKVVGVRYGGVELEAAKAPLPVPTSAELERMVTTALLEISKAFQTGDFTAFYGTISDTWKQEITIQKLQETFQEFVDQKIDLSAIEDIQPQLMLPAVNDKGFLVVAGHYSTQLAKLEFELLYIPERATWKLIGIKVNVVNLETPNE